MHPVEVRSDVARLVGLKRPDEVAGERPPHERIEMSARLLQVVFAEVREPRVQGSPHALEGLRLADADQRDGFGGAPGHVRGDRDAIPHRGEPRSRILRSS